MDGSVPTRRVASLVLAALVLGELAAGVVALLVRGSGGWSPEGASDHGAVLAAVAVAAGVTSLLAATVLGVVLRRRAAGLAAADAVAQARFAAFLVPVAILEGAYLLAVVAYLLGAPGPGVPIVAGLLFAATIAFGSRGARSFGPRDGSSAAE